MNEKKIYKEIFNEIIKPMNYQKQFSVDKDYIFISPNGYYGFIFTKNNLPFNFERIQKADTKLDLFSIVKPENECKLTNRFVMSKDKKAGMIRILKKEGYEIFVKQKYLQYFEDYAEFYQDKDLHIVVVVENGCVVGAVMPMRFLEGDKE